MSYQPKTGAKCGCRRGVQRDNCPNGEGTGWVINFAAIRARAAAPASTPGPWLRNGDAIQSKGGTWIAARGEYLPEVSRQGQTAGEWEANARLIAAAPDLLAALDKLCGYIERDMEHNAPNWAPLDIPEYARACDALAKAKGEQ